MRQILFSFSVENILHNTFFPFISLFLVSNAEFTQQKLGNQQQQHQNHSRFYWQNSDDIWRCECVWVCCMNQTTWIELAILTSKHLQAIRIIKNIPGEFLYILTTNQLISTQIVNSQNFALEMFKVIIRNGNI